MSRGAQTKSRSKPIRLAPPTRRRQNRVGFRAMSRASRPGEDIALLVLIPAVTLYALALVALFKHRAPVTDTAVA